MLAGYEPVLMRGLVAHWPLVAQGRGGLEACLQNLGLLDQGLPVDALLAKPEPTRAPLAEAGLDGLTSCTKRPMPPLFEQLSALQPLPGSALAAQSALRIRRPAGA